MSILLLGADSVSPIKEVLQSLGAKQITHWDMRKKSSSCARNIPQKTGCVVMLTNYLNHNAMKKYKKEAKKMGIPVVCAKRTVESVSQEYNKAIKSCGNCEHCPAACGN